MLSRRPWRLDFAHAAVDQRGVAIQEGGKVTGAAAENGKDARKIVAGAGSGGEELQAVRRLGSRG
jgi:hypothetical protein